MTIEFSRATRQQNLERFKDEIFDLLIIGGGITGAATARDAASRGLKTALVEKNDFAWGTSSRSSKLIHGGLRYLENLEMRLVFEALSERTHLLKNSPHRVDPLKFFMPVYRERSRGRFLLGTGLWLYDVLSFFRTPGRHCYLSKKKFLKEIPFVKAEGLKGGFSYYDARMWDDLLTIDTVRSAQEMGGAVVNYTEALGPLWEGGRINGFEIKDRESGRKGRVRARQVVVCAGPWTDVVGRSLSQEWRDWLAPSQGIHLVFDLKTFPLSGAMVMIHPTDGRISFLIPRPDYGEGVVLVGTTDGPSPRGPDKAEIEKSEINYLMDLLKLYFPAMKIGMEDVISAYVGVRPLMKQGDAASLQKISREHHIDTGPGGVIVVAGGKFTTHRTMAKEIIDTVLAKRPDFPQGASRTQGAACPILLEERINEAKKEALRRGLDIPLELVNRYGADFLEIVGEERELSAESPAGFPYLEGQMRYLMRHEMVLHLEDAYLRRLPLYLARRDHGLGWAKTLAKVWAREAGASDLEAEAELARLKKECEARSHWRDKVGGGRDRTDAGRSPLYLVK